MRFFIFITNSYYPGWTLTNYTIFQLVEISEKVFINAEVGDSLLFFGLSKKPSSKTTLDYYHVKNVYPNFSILNNYRTLQSQLVKSSECKFYEANIQINVPTIQLYKIASVSNGLNPGNIRHILLSNKKETENHQKLALGRDIQKFSILWSGTWVNYDPSLKNKVEASDIRSKAGMTAQTKVDFALRSPEIYKPDKILVRKTSDHIIAAYDSFGYYFDSLAYSIQLNNDGDSDSSYLYYLLGILNSRFINKVHDDFSLNKGKVFAKVLAKNLKLLPIRQIDFSNSKDKNLYNKMVGLVTSISNLNEQISLAKTDQEKSIVQRQLDSTDRQIDELVYELYGLTEEEIEIVEGESQKI